MNMNMNINNFGGSILKNVSQVEVVHQKCLEILVLTIVTSHSWE